MMASEFVAMDLVRLPFRLDESANIRCAKCLEELDRHQLDVELPNRLLGTCESCKTWYLIDLEEGLMLLLPGETGLRSLETK